MNWRIKNLGRFAQKGATPWNTGKKGYKQPKISKALKGKRNSLETEFKKGQTPWNKGKKWSREVREKISKANKGNFQPKGKNSPYWKGDDVSYSVLHVWVEKELGKPRKCNLCKTEELGHYEWANRSRKYRRNIKDWIRLCKSCHNRYDDIYTKGWETRRRNQT